MFKLKFRLLEEETGGEGSAGGVDIEAAAAEIADSLGFTKTEAVDDVTDTTDEEVLEDEESAKTTEDDKPAAEKETKPADEKVKSSPTSEAPKTWKPDAAKDWATLPESVKAEIHRREANIFDGIERYKTAAGVGDAVTQLIAPYEAAIRAKGSDPMKYIGMILSADKMLSEGSPSEKLSMFKQLAADYGVHLPEGGELAVEDSAVSSLRSEVQRLKSHLDGQEAQTAEAEKTRLNQEISDFASDPANPHFDAVANDIAALIKGGAAKTLAEAYEKAVWANPVTRALEVERLQTEAAKKKDSEIKAEQAKRKKLLAVNARSSGSPKSAATPLGSIDQTLEAKFKEIQARS